MFCCIFVLPSIEISLSLPVRTCLLTVSFRLKGKTVAKMPKTCANAPATPRPCRTSCDYRLYIRYRVNAEFTLPISLTFAFDSVKRNLFVCILLLLFLFGFSLSSFAFVLSRILCSRRHTHTYTRLYRQIPDKWQFNNEKLKENTKYFFRPSAEKELISLAARGTWNWRAGNGLGK